MKLEVYEKSSLIECSIEKLFAFHLDLNNLKNITPKDTKVKLLNEMFVPKEGDILRIHTVKNFLPMIWEVKIDKLTSHNLLVDIALKSPFKFWKHSHIFKDVGNGFCELKDVVEFELPFGSFGKAFNFLVYYELKKMFIYRHQITKEILQG
jgi:ligand-binding SRPBCC domain-containing protein